MGARTWQRPLTRRLLLTTGGNAAVTMALACQRLGGLAGQQTERAAAPAQPVTIRYSFYATDPEADIYRALAQEFKEQVMPNVTVETEHVVGVDYFEKLNTLIASGVEPEVMMWTTKNLASAVVKGVFAELDAFVKKSKTYKKEDIFPVEWDKNIWFGKLWALPLTHSPLVIYFNRDMFDNAGLPGPSQRWDDPNWTWDAHLDLARKMTKLGGAKPQFGYDNGTSWWSVQPFMWSNGGDYLSADHTKVQIDSPPVVEAFQWVADFWLKHHVSPLRGEVQGSSVQQLINGQVAMFAAITSTAPVLVAEAQGVRWDVAALPRRREKSQTRNPQLNAGLSAKLRFAEESWRFLEYLCGEPGMRALARLHRGLPANQKVARSADWLTPGSSVNWKVFLDAADGHAHPEHEIIKFPEMDRMIAEAYAQLREGKITALQMAQDLKPRLEVLIRENTELMNEYSRKGR
ncbi:MAG: hypothetical protein C4289_01355 [Chloroflexota bacterium]